MDIIKFNEQIIDDNKYSADLIKNYLRDHIKSQDIYDLCRKTYLFMYDAEIIKHGGVFSPRIPEYKFENLSKQIGSFLDSFSNHYNKNELLKQTLEVLKWNYLKTATSKERESKTYFDAPIKNDGVLRHAGTIYNFDMIPDWKNFFEDRILKFLNEA